MLISFNAQPPLIRTHPERSTVFQLDPLDCRCIWSYGVLKVTTNRFRKFIPASLPFCWAQFFCIEEDFRVIFLFHTPSKVQAVCHVLDRLAETNQVCLAAPSEAERKSFVLPWPTKSHAAYA